MNGSFFSLGLTNSATKLNSWLSHRLSSSPSSRNRSALFISLKSTRVFLICESSCSAAVLQSGTRWVGVGLGAGVGGDAGADGSRLCGIGAAVDERGLVGVIIGRGAEERDILLCFRAWALDEENMFVRMDEEAVAEAAMSVSESGWTSGMLWSSGCCRLK
jgi:hypothetical protein